LIYHKKYLVVKLLIENVGRYELMGIYRPQAYVKGAKGYSTECQIELYKKSIEQGESVVLNAVLFAPHGFGVHLKQGSLVTLRNGLDIEAKAVVLEIIGYK
jgi:beta-galactosidase beta subunit